MTETKYTAGPWKAGKAGVVYGADGYEVVDTTQGPHLHESHNDTRDGHWGSAPNSHIEREADEELANASLIAAAPELLDVVEKLLAWVFALTDSLGIEPDYIEVTRKSKKTERTEVVVLEMSFEQARAVVAAAKRVNK